MDKNIIKDRFDTFIRLTLYILIFMLPFGKAWAEICFFIGFILLVFKRVYIRDFKIPSTILNKPIAAFIVAAIFSVAASVYLKISFQAFFTKFLEGIIFFFMVTEVINKKNHIYVIVVLMLIASGGICIDALAQRYLTGGLDIIYQRPMSRESITATFNHPNDLAGYLLIPFFLLISQVADKIKKLIKKENFKHNALMLFLLSILVSIIIPTILLTKSRGAFLGIIIGLVFLIFLLNKKVFLILSVAGVVIFGVLASLISSHNLDRLRLAPATLQEMAINRSKIYMDVIDMVEDKPFFGHGINTFMRHFPKYKKRTVWTGATYAHNCYLQMSAEMGIVGLLCFLWIVFKLFYSAIVFIVKDGRGPPLLLIGLVSGLLAFLAHSFLDTNLYSLQLNTLFWYTVGITVFEYRRVKN